MTLLACVGVSIAGELEVRRREGVGAVVEVERVERGDHSGERRDRVVARGAGRRRGPARPGTSIHMLTEPRRPILTVSPSRSTEVGSPIRIMSGRICRSFSQSMIRGVP